MATLGILTCEILELEFAHLLAGDPDVRLVTVLENRYSKGFIKELEVKGISPRRIPILRHIDPNLSENLHVLVNVLELALHNRKRTLQQGLINAARIMGRYVDAIFLGYGLCGNALNKPEELLADAGVPIFIPMDQDHPVDDCVGLCIGGRDIYYSEQCQVAGTFFMIPGWTRHWKTIFEKEHGNYDLDMTRRIFKMSGYERALIVPTPVLSEEKMRRNTEEFCRLLELRSELRTGTLGLLERAWGDLKNFLAKHK